MIVGLVKPTSGKIFLDKQEITTDAMYRRAQGYRLSGSGSIGFQKTFRGGEYHGSFAVNKTFKTRATDQM